MEDTASFRYLQGFVHSWFFPPVGPDCLPVSSPISIDLRAVFGFAGHSGFLNSHAALGKRWSNSIPLSSIDWATMDLPGNMQRINVLFL